MSYYECNLLLDKYLSNKKDKLINDRYLNYTIHNSQHFKPILLPDDLYKFSWEEEKIAKDTDRLLKEVLEYNRKIDELDEIKN